MPVSIDQFWKLVQASRLYSESECQALAEACVADRGARRSRSAQRVAEWLVERHHLTTYQAKILLAGHPGPFVIDRYQLQHRAGSDGVSSRFLGVHLPTNHRVMLHFWRPDHGVSWEEAAAYAARHNALLHPQLDRCYMTLQTDRLHMAVTEDVDGTSIADRLRTQKRIPISEACSVAAQTALALAQLHTAGLVHSRLAPTELVVQSSGHLKLLRHPLLPPVPWPWASGHIDKFAPDYVPYLAPELRKQGTRPNALTDIYGLGCVIYQMIAGVPPFEADERSELMRRHAQEPIRPLSEYLPVPDGLDEVISFMMAKQPKLRYQTATEVSLKLQRFLLAGQRQTQPKSRRTENYYLADLHRSEPNWPSHLADGPSVDVRPEAAQRTDGPPPPVLNADGPSSLDTGETPSIQVRLANAAPRRSRSAGKRPWIWMSAVSVAVGVLVGLVAWKVRDERATSPAVVQGVEDTRVAGTPSHLGPPAAEIDLSPPRELDDVNSTTAFTAIEDDGTTLWMSPTSGPPISLRYVPSGAQCIVVVRPADLLASAEGPRVLQALGPSFQRSLTRFISETGVTLPELDRLTIAVEGDDGGALRTVLVLQFHTADQCRRVLERAASTDDNVRGTLAGWDFFVPQENAAIAVLGDAATLDEIEASRGVPLLRREMQQLLSESDEQRHCWFLLTPNFLAADGQALWAQFGTALPRALLAFLGDGIQAVSLGLQFDEMCYGELRMIATVEQNPIVLATACQQRLREIPEQLVDYLGTVSISPYWQRLAVRFPLMISFLDQQTRVGRDESQAVVNFVLPGAAAHNLILASELTIAASSEGRAVGPAAPDDSAPKSLSIDQILAQTLEFSFPQQSLEFAMSDLASAVNDALPGAEFVIEIRGKELQLEGITRNQQIRDVALENRSLAEILSELVVRANPSRASSPADPGQKLVWVVDEQADRPTVLITTRAAAERDGLTLPALFRMQTSENALE